MRTPGWRLAQVNVRPSTSSLTSHSPAARPFCFTKARLPTRRSPSSRRRTSSYVAIRSGQRSRSLSTSQTRAGSAATATDFSYSMISSFVPNGT